MCVPVGRRSLPQPLVRFLKVPRPRAQPLNLGDECGQVLPRRQHTPLPLQFHHRNGSPRSLRLGAVAHGAKHRQANRLVKAGKVRLEPSWSDCGPFLRRLASRHNARICAEARLRSRFDTPPATLWWSGAPTPPGRWRGLKNILLHSIRTPHASAGNFFPVQVSATSRTPTLAV